MVTYKLAIDERRAKQDGTFPLVVRVTYNRKAITFQTGVCLLKKHWNVKSLQVSRANENSADLNHKVSNYKVENHITTYVARHTWATTAKRLRYPNEMIAEAMGHEYGNKITNIYLDDFDQKLIDEMNDKVLLRIIPCLLQVSNPYRYVFKAPMGKYMGQPLKIA